MPIKKPIPVLIAWAISNHQGKIMRASIRAKIVKVCEAKIAAKGNDVGVSFYAFFANKNDDPELLMEVAQWWIMEMKLDHFEKARKIISLVWISHSASDWFSRYSAWIRHVGIQPESEGKKDLPRMAILPRHQAWIDQTWIITWLLGTGSHDLVVEDVVVAEEWTFIRGRWHNRAGALSLHCPCPNGHRHWSISPRRKPGYAAPGSSSMNLSRMPGKRWWRGSRWISNKKICCACPVLCLDPDHPFWREHQGAGVLQP